MAPVLADLCHLDWRPVDHLPGVGPAGRYAVPPYLARLPRYHVRIGWRTAEGTAVPVGGPVAVGAGRYCGLGLFASGGR
jgi:CRISPR-associated protein Csb2